MIPITENEENLIDNIGKETLHFHRGTRSFSVQMKDIYCYGEVDFNDKETLNKIEEFSFFNYFNTKGVCVYSNYDYKSHSCTSPIRKLMLTETWSPTYLTKMAHGYLGKPQRILLFNQTIKK